MLKKLFLLTTVTNEVQAHIHADQCIQRKTFGVSIGFEHIFMQFRLPLQERKSDSFGCFNLKNHP